MGLLILTGCCIILPGWHISLLTGVNDSEVIVSQGQWYLPFFFLQTLRWGELAGFVAMLAYTLFSSSHQIINGTESTTAILLATTVAPLAMLDSARYAALAGAHALFISFIYLVAGRFRLGFVSDFFSKPILTGYMTGTSIVLQSARSGRCLASACQVSRSSINSLN
ncbi:hypothetical protein Mhun_2812 [Methanospirillum hungatei JF-1]|uniref:SLC26A/SulP transporter domain-containing protein n=1 Tax=Methanospirillum hungatei JF-1 (strain ATCC 27890 / DSM 864 / NBRC 100397 / JF-1) TaxID=323259 RepID=Q2FTI9_METHJ|nr:SulP family inorganic anion transporter [Methanospirillum hungatei]ABD42506.1 hypothetical protein Mhun_2812 [Methanospirillum hungatei JF-1]